jgi:hypothetical protein
MHRCNNRLFLLDVVEPGIVDLDPAVVERTGDIDAVMQR